MRRVVLGQRGEVVLVVHQHVGELVQASERCVAVEEVVLVGELPDDSLEEKLPPARCIDLGLLPAERVVDPPEVEEALLGDGDAAPDGVDASRESARSGADVSRGLWYG